MSDPVKTTRRYDSSRRREQARRTREEILDAARRMFLADGYAPTTMAAIAAEVGVSVDTLYKTFRSKTGLVGALFERALEGAGPEPAPVRSARVKENEPDPRRILRAFGGFVAEVGPRAFPILLLVRDAARDDPDLAAVAADLEEQRLAGFTRDAQRLRDQGHLRDDVTVREAGDILLAYCSPELYEVLVLRRGWTPERFGSWVGEAYVAALLPP